MVMALPPFDGPQSPFTLDLSSPVTHPRCPLQSLMPPRHSAISYDPTCVRWILPFVVYPQLLPTLPLDPTIATFPVKFPSLPSPTLHQT